MPPGGGYHDVAAAATNLLITKDQFDRLSYEQQRMYAPVVEDIDVYGGGGYDGHGLGGVPTQLA